MLALATNLKRWRARRMPVLLLAASGLLLGTKCGHHRGVQIDNGPERSLSIWLNVLDLRSPPPAGASGWFTYDLPDEGLQRQRFARGQALSVARSVPLASVVASEFAGHGYETTVILYCVESNSEVQRIELPVRTASATVAALSEDGARLAVAYVGAPEAVRPEESPASTWQGRLDLYRREHERFVLAKTGPWPKPMNAQVDHAIKWLRWSPDNRTLVCEQDREIWRIAADLSEAKRIGSGKGASYSPDGRLLAIADWKGELMIVDADGKLVCTKRVDVHSGGMAWLDESRLVFTKREYHASDKPIARLCILDVAAGRITEAAVTAHSISALGVANWSVEEP